MLRMRSNGRNGNAAAETAVRLRQETTTRAQSVASEAAQRAAHGAGRARDVGAALAERTRQKLPELKDRAADQQETVAQVAQALREQMTDAAQTGAERAKDVSQRVAQDYVPTLRDIAAQAAAIALERWEAARARASETPQLAERAAGVVSERVRARETSEEILERSRRAADELLNQARRSADEILARARIAADAAAGAAGQTAERAGAAAESGVGRARSAKAQARGEIKDVSQRAAQTGNDSLGFVFWSAAAAGIVWYVLLNRERREQLERIGRAAWTQGWELWNDVKGYDEQF